MFAVSAQRTMAGARQIQSDMRKLERERIALERLRIINEMQERRDRRLREQEALRQRRIDAGIRYRPTIASIEARICRAFKLTRTELRSGRRHKTVTLARQAVMYWSCRLTLNSLPAIGKHMGGLDHTTVLHGKVVYVEKRKAMGRNLRPAR